MKRNFHLLLAVVCIVGLSMLVLDLVGKRSEEPEDTQTHVASRSAAEQGFLDAVLESPESLDNPGVRREAERHAALESSAPAGQAGRPRCEEPAAPVCTLPTGRQRQLLSDVEKPPAPQPLIEPVAADTLHFREDYASLRADAVRNPDSPENREGVISLMQARQRRLGQQ